MPSTRNDHAPLAAQLRVVAIRGLPLEIGTAQFGRARRRAAGTPSAPSAHPIVKVHIDHAKCETNALCVAMARDLFDLDGDYAVQIPSVIAVERHGEVREIVASCPTAALTVEVDDVR
jgi:ferredoxin